MPKKKTVPPKDWMQNARPEDIALWRESNSQWDVFFEVRAPVAETPKKAIRLFQLGWRGVYRKENVNSPAK